MSFRSLFTRRAPAQAAAPPENALDELCREFGEGATYSRTTEISDGGQVVILVLHVNKHEGFAAKGATTAEAIVSLQAKAKLWPR